MAFFYRHNPKKFNYMPRYFNPEEKAWEEKKAAAGLDSKLTHEEQLRAQMRNKWSASKNEETKEEQRAKLIRRIVSKTIENGVRRGSGKSEERYLKGLLLKVIGSRFARSQTGWAPPSNVRSLSLD